MSSLSRGQRETMATEEKKGMLLTLAKEFYIRRFPRPEEMEPDLTPEDRARIHGRRSRIRQPNNES